MAIKIVINGFGRIGRLVFRELIKSRKVKVVGINDLTDAKTLAHLLKYDSAHGTLSTSIGVKDNAIIVNGKSIPIFAEKDPSALP
jgi:glyceraldehyde 3-phosphate dehydrogenase